ncbi:MAG: acyl-CoA dehydrogenase family protein [Chloroflexota bacterium]|nr:acyl-CoA dehydrogenase family protein [Chloroflexota bacterium]
MDFSFSEQEEALKKEIAEFAKQELPPDWLSLGLFFEEQHFDFALTISQKLAAKGWLTMHWPKEYGGMASPPTTNLVFNEETSYWGIPGVGMGAGGTSWVGPSLQVFGTEEQKKKYLPLIASGSADGVWCTGYSEPDAGSDLANLSTTAVKVGDEYVINGGKIWNSLSHRARWNWLLARTDPNAPRHRGLSLIIVDMKSPGISIRPLYDVAGFHVVNQTFFDDVHVPVTNLVGEENRGWYHVMMSLNFERGGVANIGVPRRILDELVKYAKETNYGGKHLAKDPLIQHRLANAAVELEVCRMLGLKIIWAEVTEQMATAAVDASIAKFFVSEAGVRLANLGMQILGPYGQLTPGSKWAKLQGCLQANYLASYIMCVAGGVNEVQRNIVSQMALGLPR